VFGGGVCSFVYLIHASRSKQDRNMKGGTMTLSKEAAEALRLIQLIRKHPAPQSGKAEEKVLGRLSVDDYIKVCAALDGGVQ
jgi:hypothetical protein